MSLHTYITGYQLLKEENRIHDGITQAGYLLKEIHPGTLEPLVETDDEGKTNRPATADEMKTMITRTKDFAANKITRVKNFKSLLGLTKVSEALTVFTKTAKQHTDQLTAHETMTDYIDAQTGPILSKEQLLNIGEYVHTSITPKMPINLSDETFELMGSAVIANNLLDAASYVFKGIKPDTGMDFPAKIGFEWLRQKGIDHCNNVAIYRNRFNKDVSEMGRALAVSKLAEIGIDISYIETLFDHLSSVAGYILKEAPKAKDMIDLLQLSEHIDSEVEKLPIYQRTWALEA